MSSFIFMNGVRIASGNNIVMNGDTIYVDGKQISVADAGPVVNITVEGNIESLRSDAAGVVVNGNVGEVRSTSGSVSVREDVSGSVSSVSGSVRVGGSVGGSVSTVSGSVRHS